MDIEPPQFAELKPIEKGSVARGCGIGCLCQLVFVGIGLVGLTSQTQVGKFLFVGWGITQWIAMGPLIWKQEEALTKQGMIISASIGFILSSACATMLLHP
jgi:hypothetical protein